MATPRVFTIAPSGGDYTSVGAAISDQVSTAPDLVTDDVFLKLEVESGDYTSVGGGVNYTPDTGGITINGFTTDADHYIWITPAAGHAHTGKMLDGSGDYTGAALRTTSSVNNVIYNLDGYVFITNMILHQAAGTGNSYQYAIRCFTGAVFCLSAGNILCTGCTVNSANGGGVLNQNGLFYSLNDYIFNDGAGGGIGIYSVKSGGSFSLFYNTTVRNFWINCYTYPSTSYDNVKWRNVISAGSNTADFAGGQVQTIWDSCVSGDGSMTSSLGGTVTNDIASGTLAFASSDSPEITSGATSAIDTGADLSSDPDFPISTDILGVSRPQGSAWDRGAWEYVAAVSAATTERARTRARGVRRY